MNASVLAAAGRSGRAVAAVSIIGLILTLAATGASYSASRRLEQEQFNRAVAQAATSLTGGINRLEVVTNAIHGLHAGGARQTEDEFRTFVSRLTGGVPLATRYPGVHAVGLLAGDGDDTITIELLAPAGLAKGLRTGGFTEDAGLHQALRTSIELGVPRLASAEESSGADTALVAPVLAPGRSSRNSLDLGNNRWVLILLNRDEFVKAAISGSGLSATATDLEDSSPGADSDASSLTRNGQREILVTVAGHTWRVSFLPSEGFYSGWQRHQHQAVAAGGFVITALLAGIVLSQAAGRTRALAEVDQATADLRMREEQFRSLASSSPTGIFLASVEGRVAYANQRLGEILEMPPESLYGTELWHRLGLEGSTEDQLANLTGSDGQAIRLPDTEVDERWVQVRAAPVARDDGSPQGYVGTVEDVTARVVAHEALAEREAMHRELAERFAHQARHDPLTGLPNRTLLGEALHRVLHENPHDAVALLLIDLDGFKLVNDSLGHAAGDALLQQVADRLSLSVRSDDVVARLGGDEFAVLLTRLDSTNQAEEVAERVLWTLQQPVDLDGVTVNVSGSIGIATSNPASDGRARSGVDDLLRQADLAMYAAKQSRPGTSAKYAHRMHEDVTKRLTLERELRATLDAGALEVAYQPVVELDTGRVAIVEALARWHHPELGTIPPDVFIPVAEQTGMIDDLGDAVLRRVVADSFGWGRPGESPPHVAVNVSAKQLAASKFVARVLGHLEIGGMLPSQLVIEVTESDMMAREPAVRTTLCALRDAGVRVAIDDFGSGYSSLAHLRELPVDLLKIDRAFVADTDAADTAMAFLRAITALGRTVGCQLVAEGVETAEHIEAVRGAGCEYGQGYFLLAPVPSVVIGELLAGDVRLPRRVASHTVGSAAGLKPVA